MKNFLLTIVFILFTFTLTAGTANAQLLQQQFTGPLTAGNQGGGTMVVNSTVTSDPNYVNISPSNSQFTFMGTTAVADTILINGTDGLLRLYRGGGGSLSLIRNANFSGPPTSLMVKFDFNVLSSTASNGLAQFMVGSNFLNNTADPGAANKHSLFYIFTKNPSGTWGVNTDGITVTSTTFTTAQTVLWVINNSGGTLTYTDPNSATESVGDDKFDVWIGTTKIIDEAPATTGTVDLNNFDLRLAGGTGRYTIDNLLIQPISQYTLTYTAGANGSITGTSPQTVSYGGNGTQVTAVPNTGYHFVNWSDGVLTASRTDLNVTGDISVTANFAINSYTVTFDPNGGTGSMSDQSGNYNTTAALTLNAFTRTGYTFAGWNTAANGSGTTYADGANYTFTASITLYAQWTINSYTVTFDPNGGTGSMSNQTATYNTTEALTSNSFTRTGYTFAGWNTAANGSGTSYANDANYTFTASITLYAQWTINSYTVTFDPNGGTGSMSNQSGNYNTTAALTSNAFTRTGYTFAGWNTAANGSGTSYADGASYTFTASIALYAQWTINSYTVTFDPNGGTGSMSNQSGNYNTTAALTSNAFTRTGYTFAGWNTSANGSGTSYADGASHTFTASITLYAQWTINSYTVTFDPNGGTGSMSNQSGNYNTTAALTSNAFTRTGYTFAGWNTAANGSGTSYANGANYTFTASITFYAQWTINSYTVTFDPNGGTGSMGNQSGNYNTTAALTSNTFTRTGYTFAGWNTAANGSGTGYPNGANYTFTASTTLYAQWTINSYTLTYTAGANGSITGTTPQTVTYGGNGTAVTAVPNSGYYFVNWSDASTANPRTDLNITANISVTANFALTQYTITMTATNHVVAGVSPLALDGVDPQDIGMPPPPPSNYVQLYSLLAPGQPIANYVTDIRKDEAGLAAHAKHWDIRAVSDLSNSPESITFSGSTLPSGFRPVMYNLQTGAYQDVSANPLFPFILPAIAGQESDFTLLIGDSTKPSVTVTQPNGGEAATMTRPYTIKWMSSDGTGILRHYVYYSLTGSAPYTLIDSTNGNVDSLVWTPGTYSASARIKVVARDSVLNEQEDVSNQIFTINQLATFLAPLGWNLLSVPLLQADMSPAALFGDNYGVEPYYIWEYSTATGYIDPPALSMGRGCWLGANIAQTIDVAGTALSSVNTPLFSGFNIIGDPFMTDEPTDSLTFTDGLVTLTMAQAAGAPYHWLSPVLYKYNGSGYGYQTGSLGTWKGYWIPMLSTGITIHYSAQTGPTAQKQAVAAAEPMTKNRWNVDLAASLKTADNRILTDNVASFGVRSDAAAGFDSRYDAPRPPRSPGKDYLEVSFPVNGESYPKIFGTSYARTYKAPGKASWEFVVNASAAGTVTLTWDNNGLSALGRDVAINLYDETAHKLVDMKKAGTYTYRQAGTSRQFSVRSSAQAIPQTFQLVQNFPNPFNPSTVIRFGLPQDASVTLEVYNTVGQKVVTLLDGGTVDAGYHEVTFDASRLASGVYIYRLSTTGSSGMPFSESKKMLLLK
jgi:uncharacterized repeat protein (TIGR02543 family)